MNITTLGIDLAKNIFQLHGVNDAGETLLTKIISRKKCRSFSIYFWQKMRQSVRELEKVVETF